MNRTCDRQQAFKKWEKITDRLPGGLQMLQTSWIPRTV